MSVGPDDPRMLAAIDMLRRTGQRSFQLRYSDDEDPLVWMAVGEWCIGPDGRPVRDGGEVHHEAAAALTPFGAVFRLCEQAMDGGTCAHCGRPSGITMDWRESMPLAEVLCWTVYDPETSSFRRSCEGETP